MKLTADGTAFLFPGQGSQALGMGAELAEANDTAAAVFQRADDQLGFPLSDLMWNGPEEELNDTINTQPALLIHSIAVLRVFQEAHPHFQPAYTAGHSMGEFTALVAAGALSFEEALFLVRERGAAMKDAGEENPGGMAAVLGLEAEEVAAACRQASQGVSSGVWLANDNCPGQIVISGDPGALERASGLLQEAGARRVVPLAVSIAAHTPFMANAQKRFGAALHSVTISDPQIPVVGNVSAEPMRTAAEVREDLNAQLTSTVRWTESVQQMLGGGVSTFVELGSGNVLTGLLRRIDRSAQGVNLDSPSSFETLEE